MNGQIEEMAEVLENAKIDARATIGSMNNGFGVWYAQALYNAGYRKQSEWISVEDRLPDREGETVLYYDGKEVDACNFYFEKFHTIDLYESDIIDGVTHWMPLPEPPKGGG